MRRGARERARVEREKAKGHDMESNVQFEYAEMTQNRLEKIESRCNLLLATHLYSYQSFDMDFHMSPFEKATLRL